MLEPIGPPVRAAAASAPCQGRWLLLLLPWKQAAAAQPARYPQLAAC